MILFLGFNLKSQVYYTTNPKYLKQKTEQNNLLSRFNYFYPDTMVTDLGNYFPRNFLGNTGLASPQYLLNYGSDPLGFRLWNAPLSNDRIKDEQVEYYRTKGPYASLTGIAGSKEYQAFKMIFTHTYKDKVNVTLKFNRYTSKGFYQKQQTYTNNVFLSSNYTTKNKCFGYYLYLLNNGNKGIENGGIRDGVLNDSTAALNKELLPVNLSSASRDNRELKAMINPWLRLNDDRDSLRKSDHFLQLKSNLGVSSYRYKDAVTASDTFYKAIYLDTLQTLDSARVFQLKNELNYSVLGRTNNLGLSFGYRNEITRVWQKTDSVFMNHIARADFIFQKRFKATDTSGKRERVFENTLNAEYAMSGPNSGNYKLESKSVFNFLESKNHYVFLNILYENRNADYLYNTWVSNHFFWYNNGFNSQQQLQLKGGINFRKWFNFSILHQSIQNFLYFDKNALPAQLKSTVNNTALNIQLMKVFFKHLGVGFNYMYQVTNQKAYMRMPQSISTAKLFYHGNLFKNNLQLQLGTQLQIYDPFYAYAYMPSTQVFYLQDKFKTQAYPYLDVFLQARIRPVSFFIKMENSLFGFAGTAYAFTPGYYQTDRAFRLGINWVFFD